MLNRKCDRCGTYGDGIYCVACGWVLDDTGACLTDGLFYVLNTDTATLTAYRYNPWRVKDDEMVCGDYHETVIGEYNGEAGIELPLGDDCLYLNRDDAIRATRLQAAVIIARLGEYIAGLTAEMTRLSLIVDIS